MRRKNLRLRSRLNEYKRLLLVSAAAAVVLAFALGFVALQGPPPVVLGVGRAGVGVSMAGFGGRMSPTQPPKAAGESDSEAVEERSGPETGKHVGSGEASYYGDELAGNPTASGERFNPSALTAAHRTLPLGSRVRVTNVRNGKSVVVRVNDRGPYAKRRVIDLSRAAAKKLGMLGAGTAMVRLELLR